MEKLISAAFVKDIILIALCALTVSIIAILSFKTKFAISRKRSRHAYKGKIIGFFHPNCSAGGGGERVLWSALAVLGKLYDRGFRFSVVIYTADVLRQEDKQRYKDKKVEERQRSMIGQSFVSMKLAYQAIDLVTPDVFFDTTGCAFTFVVAKVLASCEICAYVHYPTISTDMLALVFERRPSYNNNETIVSSPIRSYLKLVYYFIFALSYGLVGSLCDVVMVNSSWTYGHIKKIWIFCSSIQVIFPPCDTANLEHLSLTGRKDIIISIGQFRPEKDHKLQLKAFSLLLKDPSLSHVRLILIGSCRDQSDIDRVDGLQLLAKELKIEDNIDFVLNQPHSVLKEWFGKASVGIHTMWNEHFGIGVVEMMAAGLLTIAHNSGGPKSDIINPGKTGFLATTADEYANIMQYCLRTMDSDQILDIRNRGRESAFRFSDDVFATTFEKAIIASSILI